MKFTLVFLTALSAALVAAAPVPGSKQHSMSLIPSYSDFLEDEIARSQEPDLRVRCGGKLPHRSKQQKSLVGVYV